MDARPCRKRAWSSPPCSSRARSLAEVARRYGVHQSWVVRAHRPLPGGGRSRVRAPIPPAQTVTDATAPATVELVLRLRKDYRARPRRRPGHHRLAPGHHHDITVSRSTIHRILTAPASVDPGAEEAAEVVLHPVRGRATERDLAVRLHPLPPHPPRAAPWRRHRDHHLARRPLPLRPARLRTPPGHRTNRPAHLPKAADQHGYPASTLTDNGMVYTVRLAGGRGGRNALENELRRPGIVQKNSRPNHPTTCGKVERFQQTMKNWLRAQPAQPATLAELQTLLDRFVARVQPPPPAPVPAPPSHPRHHLQRPPQGHPDDRPHRRHPRPRPHRPGLQDRHRHPAPPRPPAPHRHRPNPRPNPHPPARPGPRHPHHRRRHRRTPPRTHPRPQPRLPATGRPPGPQKSNSRTHET